MSTLIHERVAAAQARANPTVICRMPSGWAVLRDVQFLRGYSLLLPDPVSLDLNALDHDHRAQYLLDMATVGDALLKVTGAFRINDEILGNLDPALHAHIIPRYLSEPQNLRKGPAFFYDGEFRNSIRFDRERDQELLEHIAAAIQARL